MRSAREQALREYQDLVNEARAMGRDQLSAVTRGMALQDLYFLLLFVLDQTHMNEGPEYKRDFLFDRCREVQAEPDGRLDLWGREHYKSTIITYGLTIFDILNDPEETFGIFSFNRPIAKAFLNQIKREFEKEKLRRLFPEILWKHPEREAPKWSENDGIIVKRRGNPKEATVEAWGLVDGQPSSKHFGKLIYDDIITEDSVTNPEKIRKVTKYWELSLNLSKEGGVQRYAGTIYHFADTYQVIRDRGVAVPRIYPATHDGTVTGRPVLFTPEYLAKKKQAMSSYVFACQLLLNPKAASVSGFDENWLRFWNAEKTEGLNIYILVDPASSKKKAENDYTVMLAVGLGPDENYYLVDGLRDKLNLTEKANRLLAMHRAWRPLAVGYEEYGLQADIEYIRMVQEDRNYRFDITPLGGRVKKEDRIEGLIPLFQAGRWYLPEELPKRDFEGNRYDLAKDFIREEYRLWPYVLHDDILDAMARITDPGLGAEFPLPDDDTGAEDEAANDWDPLGRRAAA